MKLTRNNVLSVLAVLLVVAAIIKLVYSCGPRPRSSAPGTVTFSWDAQPGIDVFKLYATNLAVSAKYEDVKAVARDATNGQTIYIPAGTATWTSTLTVNPGVSVIGAGTNATFIIDEVPRSPNQRPVLSMSGTNFELSGITFKRGMTNTSVNYSGVVQLSGANFRMHDIMFDRMAGLSCAIWSTSGLVDHVLANCPENEVIQTFGTGYGDKEWASPVQPGTVNELYIEDCYFQDNNWNPACDAYGGSILVIRHCVFTNSWTGNHGTDSSQRQRSCRWMEVYQNSFYFPAGVPNVPWPWTIYYRGGSGVVWSNSFAGRYTQGVKLATYRNDSGSWPPWGRADGTSPWDGNTDTNGYPVLDQCGRGMGDLITGNPPINASTGTATWPHNASERIYVWGDKMAIDNNGPDYECRVQHASILTPRDYVVGTPMPGYTPFQYPHPLQSGTNVPPPTPTPTPTNAPNWGLVATIPGNMTNYQASVATIGSRAAFFLTASNFWGESGPSNLAGTPASPNAPTGFKLTSN